MIIKVTLCHVKDRGHYINTDHIQKMVGAYFIPDNISYTELSMIDGSNYAIKESPEDILDMIDEKVEHYEMIKEKARFRVSTGSSINLEALNEYTWTEGK